MVVMYGSGHGRLTLPRGDGVRIGLCGLDPASHRSRWTAGAGNPHARRWRVERSRRSVPAGGRSRAGRAWARPAFGPSAQSVPVVRQGPALPMGSRKQGRGRCARRGFLHGAGVRSGREAARTGSGAQASRPQRDAPRAAPAEGGDCSPGRGARSGDGSCLGGAVRTDAPVRTKRLPERHPNRGGGVTY